MNSIEIKKSEFYKKWILIDSKYSNKRKNIFSKVILGANSATHKNRNEILSLLFIFFFSYFNWNSIQFISKSKKFVLSMISCFIFTIFVQKRELI
jgi:hypothetical protein